MPLKIFLEKAFVTLGLFLGKFSKDFILSLIKHFAWSIIEYSNWLYFTKPPPSFRISCQIPFIRSSRTVSVYLSLRKKVKKKRARKMIMLMVWVLVKERVKKMFLMKLKIKIKQKVSKMMKRKLQIPIHMSRMKKMG